MIVTTNGNVIKRPMSKDEYVRMAKIKAIVMSKEELRKWENDKNKAQRPKR